MTDDAEDELMMVALHPALVEPFKEWLASRGCRLGKLPDEVSAEPVWIVTPDAWS